MFFQVDYLLVLTQKDQIDWKHHSDRVHTLGRHDPETAAKARPTLSLSEQAYESAHVAVCYGCFGRDERLPRLVVHTDCTTLVIIRHRPTPTSLSIWIRGQTPFLLHHLPAAPPNDNEQHYHR